ncbi:MAG: tetratricopeptide repeat protein [bacterium]
MSPFEDVRTREKLRVAFRPSIVIAFVASCLAAGGIALPAASQQRPAIADDAPTSVVPTRDLQPLPVASQAVASRSLGSPGLVPPSAAPEAGREIMRAAWEDGPATPHARAAALLRARLELGLGDLKPAALALLRSASAEEPEIHAELARDLAPGLPRIQMAAAQAHWAAGEIGTATQALLDALLAVRDDFGVQLWLLENFSILLLMVVVGASLAFMLLAALAVFPHAAHDLGDLLSRSTPGFARAAALVTLLLLPLALGEGLLGLSLALFALGFAYGKAHQRSVLTLAAVLLILGLHPLAQLVSITTTLVDRDPVAESATAVVQGLETGADVERLERAEPEDLLAAHALAYRARRHGREEEARRRLDSILARVPTDAVALANRGNLEMRSGRIAPAIDYYERAAAILDSPILLFDLSQAYASAFRMDEYERALARAQRLGDDAVSALSRVGEADLVADLEVPEELFIDRFRALALAQDHGVGVAEALAPGRLGDRWLVTAGAFALVALSCLLFAGRFDHASLCARCGHRICTRCEETVWSEEICEDCHRLFQNPEATDPSLRMARLQALAEREARIGRVVWAASLIVPGVAGLAARRPDLAMFGLLLSGWALGWLLWPSGVLVDPLMMGGAAFLCFAIPGALSVLAYGAVVVSSLVVRKNL